MKKEIKTGLFAVIVIIVTLFMIEFLRGKDIFSRNDTFYIIYPEVEGIGVSTGVTVGGYPAGTVSDMTYNPVSKDYMLTVSISKEFRIPADSRMEIYSADILGTRKIRVLMGQSDTFAVSGDTLSGTSEADMISSLAGSIQPTMLRIDTLIRNLNTTVTAVNMVLDEENRTGIKETIESINNSAKALSMITAGISGKSPEIENILQNLSSMTDRLDSASSSIEAAAVNAEIITASLKDAPIQKTADSIYSLVSRIQNPDGSIGKLLVSDSLYNSLTRLSNSLDSLVSDISRDPKKYIKISIF